MAADPISDTVVAAATLVVAMEGLGLGSILLSTEVLVLSALVAKASLGATVTVLACTVDVSAIAVLDGRITSLLVPATLVATTTSFGGTVIVAAVKAAVVSLGFRASILSFAADDMVEDMRELDPFLALRVTGMVLERGS